MAAFGRSRSRSTLFFSYYLFCHCSFVMFLCALHSFYLSFFAFSAVGFSDRFPNWICECNTFLWLLPFMHCLYAEENRRELCPFQSERGLSLDENIIRVNAAISINMEMIGKCNHIRAIWMQKLISEWHIRIFKMTAHHRDNKQTIKQKGSTEWFSLIGWAIHSTSTIVLKSWEFSWAIFYAGLAIRVKLNEMPLFYSLIFICWWALSLFRIIVQIQVHNEVPYDVIYL